VTNTLCLVIPVFNEAANVGRLLGDVSAAAADLCAAADCGRLRVLLVDDGSTDDTATVAGAIRGPFDLDVLRHAHNRGPGAAFTTAFAGLRPHLCDRDRVFTLEGDNTSRLDTARRMLLRQKEGYDAVLASPYAYGGGFRQTSLLRLLLSQVANGMLKGLVGIHGIHTMSSFFRLYTGELLRRLQKTFGPGIVERTGFESMVELLIKMILVGASISEVEMVLDSSRRVGPSKMKIGRTIRGYLALYRLRRKWARQAHSELTGYVLNAR
jgi:dolichol-phosphate mannosyltransferase